MATDSSILEQAIIDYLEGTCGWTLNGNDGECLAKGIAEAVVQHIKDYAEVESSGDNVV